MFDLWRNGQIKGKRAAESVEIICKMSEYIKDAQKKNDVQAMAAKLLADGESWDCINVAIQTMAARDMEAKSGKMKQGWLFFGAGFEEELKQRGRFAARSIEFLRQKIKAGEGAQRASENAEEVARQGYTVTRKEGSEEYTLEELVRLMERFKHMASDAELMRDSLEWDGESKLDPIARYLTPERKEDMEEQMRREQEEKEREAREYLEAHVDSLFGGDMGSAQMVGRNEGEKRYRVVNDTTGLSEHLNDVVKPIEINFTPKDAPAENTTWVEDFKEFYSKFLAGKELVIKRSGHKMYFHDSSEAKSVAVKGVRNQKRNETGKKMEEVVVEAYHLYQGTPEHKENEGNHRKKMVNASDEFHVFGHPATVNGEKMMVCFTAIHRKDEKDPKRLRFYEFGTPSVMQKKDGEPFVRNIRFHRPASPSEDTLADYLKNVNSDFEGKPKIVEEGSDISMSVADAREKGLFKDGVMELGNGVLVDGGADFSASVDFSHVSPALYRRPDREHVGTGEGNQVFGWGYLYGAESPEVNRFYHKSFSGFVSRPKFTKDGEPIDGKEVEEALRRCGVDDEKFLESLYETAPGFAVTREHLEKVRAVFVHSIERDINILPKKFLKESKNKVAFIDYMLENKVGMTVERTIQHPVNYRMRADVDDGNLLHWDESFDYFWANHEEVQDALKALLPADVFDSLWGFEDGYGIWQAITGGGFYEILTKQLGSPRAASEWLDAHGIRGVKYLDGVSRGRWERREEDEPYTYNYVIFNPDYIEVIAINNRHEWSEYSEDNPDWQKPEDVDFSASVRNLAAVHTLSVEKFLAAGKMGGMPLPSVAVTRLDRPYRWGDDETSVTLVARPEMVDPEKGTQVYERDAWTGSIPQGAVEERNGRMVVNLGWGNYEEATPERLAELMEGRKRRGFEATSNWVDPKEAARAYLARRLRSMDEVKGMREKLSDEEERVVDDEEIEEWMESVSELGLTEQDWQSIFEALADLDEVTEESVREAIMRWEPEGDDFVELWDLKESDAMKEGSEFLQGAVRVISGLREEVRDYLEAVPQRAVVMDEWAYALFSEKIPEKAEVRRVCRENGIVPVEYKAGERDRALGDLIDNAEVSFSLTFSPAERSGLRALRELANGAQEARFRSDTLGQDVVFALGSAGELKDASNPKSRVVGAFGFIHLISMRMAHGESMEEACYTACKAVMAAVNGRVAKDVEGQQKELSLDGYRSIVRLTWQDEKKAWMVTGYKEDGESSKAGDRQRASSLAASYALDSFGGLKEVGAALDYGIARLAQEYKQNNADSSRKAAKRYYGDFSGAMRRAREMELTRRVHELLLGRREEREARAMVEAWDDWMERFKVVMAGKEGEKSRLGRGMEAMGRMVALLESTRSALPGRYRVGWLDVQLRWATWYAQMMESGEVTLSEELKDDKRYAAWAARFRDEVARKEGFGVSEQGLKEFLADMVGKRMDAVLENVAAKCRRTLERFLKDRARERMDDIARRLYPKRERGKAWPRGKADAETYRFVQEAYKHMEAKPGERGEGGDYEAETQRLESLLEEETDEGKRAELSKEVKMRRMFGEWGKMSYEQALAAEEYFTERVISGRDAWAEKQQERREKIAYIKAKVRERKGWKGYGEEATINAQVEETAEKGTGLKNVINFPFYAFTSFTGKMMGWRKELGGWFAERMSRKWAQMNVGIKGRTDEMRDWFMQAVGTVSGRKTAEGIAEWIREQNVLMDTGITLVRKEGSTRRITAEEAQEWMNLTPEERRKKRDKMRQDAEADERLVTLPSEEDIAQMRELYTENPERKWYEIKGEKETVVRLRTSKLGVLNGLLMLERPSYARLMEVNGVTPEVMEQMREFVGADLLRLGEMLRGRFAQMLPELAEKYEGMFGIPFASEKKYWPGRFFLEEKGVEDEEGRVKITKNGMPGKPGFLVPLQQHQRIINWGKSALDVFLGGAQDQINWIVTAEFIDEWTALFADKKFAAEMGVNCGTAFLGALKGDILTLVGAGVTDSKMTRGLDGLLRKWMRITSLVTLSWNATTVAKNATALLNGMCARVPEIEVTKSRLARVLDSKRIGMLELLEGYFKGPYKLKEINRKTFIEVRRGKNTFTVASAAREAAGKQRVLGRLGLNLPARFAKELTEMGMKGIEWTDVESNVMASMAVANAVYNAVEKQDENKQLSEAEKRRIAEESAVLMLETCAQPFIASQKSTAATRRAIAGSMGDAMFYMYKSEVMAKFSWLLSMLRGGNAGDRVFASIGFSMFSVVATLLGALAKEMMRQLYGLLSDDDPEPEKDYWKNLGIETIMSVPSDMPLIGEFADKLSARLRGKYYGYNEMIIPGLGLYRAAQKVFAPKTPRTTEGRIKDISTLIKTTAQAGVLLPSARPFASLTELTLAAGALSNIPAKVATASGKTGRRPAKPKKVFKNETL